MWIEHVSVSDIQVVSVTTRNFSMFLSLKQWFTNREHLSHVFWLLAFLPALLKFNCRMQNSWQYVLFNPVWFDETGKNVICRDLAAKFWVVPACTSIAWFNFQWSSFRIPYWILYRKSKWQTKIKLHYIIKKTMTFISLRRIVKVTIWHHSTNKNRSYWY